MTDDFKNLRIRRIWIYLFIFILGFSISFFLNIPSSLEFASGSNEEKSSPSDWVSEDQIKVSKDKIVINVKNARWSKIANTNSMDPILDEGSNALQIVPKSYSELNVGDIITYEHDSDLIIHRIIYIGNDGDWYAIVKGDNNSQPDQTKVRFSDVKKVLIGIIY